MSEQITTAEGDVAAHVMVVDDDPRLRRLLQRYLFEHGFRVSVAANATEARHTLEGIQPDALVLDMTMPGENGLELTR
ncbi:MAG: response regulator, partial [Acetobacter sp.]|nr:response regulator [Acetobacter sp.]